MTVSTACFPIKDELVIAAQQGDAVAFVCGDKSGYFTNVIGLTNSIVEYAVLNGTYEPCVADLDPQVEDDAIAAEKIVLDIIAFA